MYVKWGIGSMPIPRNHCLERICTMGKTINVTSSELASIRAGRANPKILDKILVD